MDARKRTRVLKLAKQKYRWKWIAEKVGETYSAVKELLRANGFGRDLTHKEKHRKRKRITGSYLDKTRDRRRDTE